MATRRDSLELGPSLEWETRAASFNLAWFGDASGQSRGSSVRAAAYRQFIDSARWDVGGYVGLDRSSARAVIALVELTKEYQIRAIDTGDYVGMGVMTAGIYFAMSYAASLGARALERRLRHDRG